MHALPSYPLDDDDDRPASADDGDDDARPTRPALKSGVHLGACLDDVSFSQRADLEFRLYRRGRYAPEYRTISVATLKRLDAMFERLATAASLEEAMREVHGAFVHEDERRAALVPLLGVLYPLAYFDERMPTADVVRLVAHYERRKPAAAP